MTDTNASAGKLSWFTRISYQVRFTKLKQNETRH